MSTKRTATVTKLTPKVSHDPSYARGWNDLAQLACGGWEDFDVEKYVSGVMAAATELRRLKDERAARTGAHAADIEAAKELLSRLEKAGFYLDMTRPGVEFEQATRIQPIQICDDDYDNDIPF